MPRAIDKHPQKRGVGASIFNPLRSGIASYDDPMAAIQNDMAQIGGPFRKLFSNIGAIFGLPSPEEIVVGVANGVGSVISGAVDFLGSLGEHFVDLVGGFANILKIPILDATKILNLPGLFNNVQDFLDALASAFGGGSSGNNVSTVAAYSIEVAQAAQRAEASAYAAQLAIAALAKDLDAEHDGAVFDMTFSGADGAALNPADWATTGPTTGDMCVRLVNGTPTMGIKAGAATDSLYFAGCAHIYETDDQSISVIIAGGNSDTTAATRLYFHCNAGNLGAATRGLYLDISSAGVKLGYFVKLGGIPGVLVYTLFGGNATIATQLSSGMRVEVRNIGNVYQIVLNGAPQPTYIDTANKAVAGDFYAFVTMETKTKVWNAGTPWQNTAVRMSYFLAGVLMADYAPISYKGSGARMYRTSTANVAASSGTNLLANNVFSVIDDATSDIAVDLVTGKFTVSQPGWYFVTLRLALTASSDSSSGSTGVGYNVTPYPMQMAIYKNGSIEKYVGESLRAYADHVSISGGGNTIGFGAVGPDAAYGSTSVYLSAGDYIQIGYTANSSDSSTFTGEATGTKTYFEIQGKAA